MISAISASMRQNLPLSEALLDAAVGNNKVSTILADIADGIADGLPLSEAVRANYRACPGHVVATIYAAECLNQVPQAVAALEQELLVRNREERAVQPVHPLYPIFVMLLSLITLLGLMIFVVPKFAEIYKQEGAVLPEATSFLLGCADFLIDSAGALLLVLVLILLPVVTIIVIVKKFRNRRPERLSWLSRLADWFKWRLPLLRWFEWNYSMARVTNMLRLALTSGRTVNQAIDAALMLDMNHRVWKRLLRWRDEVIGGQNVSQSARKCGLGQSLAWAFDSSLHNGLETPAILENLEEFHRSSYRCRLAVARQIIWPCVILLVGSYIGFMVYALMAPLIGMIYASAGGVMP
jgi:type II secretory pathway component PulF